MSTSSPQISGWTVVATVEVADTEAIAQFLPRESSEYRFQRAPQSPQGFIWIDIYVDFGSGIEHASRIARTVLGELAACGLTDFRIIAGRAYLDLTSLAPA
ncbi:MAG: hypothetical protein ACTHK2_11300 [Dokdonella sp.]|uniref:hypothetical protein n=1 Tax=Dokdonella sp. TaxID=2291710 RepID=UPI003F7DD635